MRALLSDSALCGPQLNANRFGINRVDIVIANGRVVAEQGHFTQREEIT
jgi:hypothetical protein